MKHRLLIFLLLASASLMAHAPVKEHPKPPLSVSLPLLKQIEHEAITLGHGPTVVHAFIDPMCPRSREFISMISQSSKMQSLYTYRFYLYELPRFHSAPLIRNIYASPHRLQSLLKVMEHNGTVKLSKVTVTPIVQHIAKVAEKIGVYKRPYLILVKGKH